MLGVAVVGAFAWFRMKGNDTDRVERGQVQDRFLLPGPPVDGVFNVEVEWLTAGEDDGHRSLYRLKTWTGEIYEVPDTTGAQALAELHGQLWVSVCDRVIDGGCLGRAVARVDASTVRERIPLEGGNVSLAAGLGALWITADGDLYRLDPETSSLTRVLAGRSLGQIVVAASNLWAHAYAPKDELLAIDMSTGEIRASVEVSPDGSCGLASDGSRAWAMGCGQLAPMGSPGVPLDTTSPTVSPAPAPVLRSTLVGIDGRSGAILVRRRFDGEAGLVAGDGWVGLVRRTVSDSGELQLTLQGLDPAEGAPLGVPIVTSATDVRFGCGGGIVTPGPPSGVVFNGNAWIMDCPSGAMFQVPVPPVAS